MFDAAPGGGESYRESKHFQAGSRAVVADLPWGSSACPSAMICGFQASTGRLRRPGHNPGRPVSLYSAYRRRPLACAGAGPCHRDRQLCAGCGPGRPPRGGRETFGHSIAVSPWGQIIAEAGDGVQPSVILADIVSSEVDDARRQMPSLGHDRHFDVARVTGLEGTGRTP